MLPLSNNKPTRVICPQPTFYKLFSQEQIHDTANNLEVTREIPWQYGYFGDGALYWEKYAQRLAAESVPNLLNATTRLLENNKRYIDFLLSRYKKVNIIDIGVGDASPVKELLERLIKQNKLGRYMAVDISTDMMSIARRNIEHWFGGQAIFESHQRDINHQRFSDLLIKDAADQGTESTVNLVLFLGGVLNNLRSPEGVLGVIHDSMGSNDLFMHTTKLDTRRSRNYFEFNLDPGNVSFSPGDRFLADLLNIDESLYEVEMGYDAFKRRRYIQLRLKVPIMIKFKFSSGERTVGIDEGDAILVWYYWQQTATEIMQQFDQSNFCLLQTSQTEDQEYMLTISRVKREDTFSL